MVLVEAPPEAGAKVLAEAAAWEGLGLEDALQGGSHVHATWLWGKGPGLLHTDLSQSCCSILLTWQLPLPQQVTGGSESGAGAVLHRLAWDCALLSEAIY